MTSTAKRYIVPLILLCATSSAHASSCTGAITRTQAQLDLAIEHNAGSHGWKPESLNALRSYQPTPRSLAAAENGNGPDFTGALDSLARARAADRAGNTAACNRELARARAVLR
ncbi:hypothetical protein [Bradyrhizobium neotropicale]|uniref:Uncharacterized protein n=1 Tax=Bradyrhizobium neotropicale TaxID=1497615 RepID=A0A176ZI62_9BRAD|nr:hypothetical protein [Bradyrhizobium neotropicale]OAF19466.1 hypothetical protein AXW67_36950 [Bradyrhizobium neotropicale]